MKGPYERLKYDFRRGWECPVCHRREKTEFTVTGRTCGCQSKKEGGREVSMLLVEDGVRRIWSLPKAAMPANIESIPPAATAPVEPIVDRSEIPETTMSPPEPQA